MSDKLDLTTIKNMDIKSIIAMVNKMRTEIADLLVEKNMNKLKDLKSIYKKRKELARTLTILSQKKSLEKMEKEGGVVEAKI